MRCRVKNLLVPVMHSISITLLFLYSTLLHLDLCSWRFLKSQICCLAYCILHNLHLSLVLIILLNINKISMELRPLGPCMLPTTLGFNLQLFSLHLNDAPEHITLCTLFLRSLIFTFPTVFINNSPLTLAVKVNFRRQKRFFLSVFGWLNLDYVLKYQIN